MCIRDRSGSCMRMAKKNEKKHTEHERMHVFGTTEHERNALHTRITHWIWGQIPFWWRYTYSVMHNTSLYVHIVHTMNWACQNTSDTRATTTEKHEKMPKIPWKMRKNTGAPRSKIPFLTSLSCSVCFFSGHFWKFSCNRRRHWAREDFFYFVRPSACGWD